MYIPHCDTCEAEIPGDVHSDGKGGIFCSFACHWRYAQQDGPDNKRPLPLPIQSFESLAAQQGVGPLEDWDKLTNDWPPDADFDAFLAAMQQRSYE